MDGSSKKENCKDIVELNSAINQLDPIDIYIMFIQQKEDTHSLQFT